MRRPGGWEGVWGACLPDYHEIHLEAGMSVYRRWVTFCHEVVHALAYEYQEQLPSLRKLLGHKLIERVEEPIAILILETFMHPEKFDKHIRSILKLKKKIRITR